MRILVVGATGTIGREIVRALASRHEVVEVSHSKAKHRVDIADPESIRSLYRAVGKLDAVVSAAGSAAFKPLDQLGDADFELSLRNKLMGQVNLVRLGIGQVEDGGSFTLTSGVLAIQPAPGTAAISLVNGALESFTRAVALELPRGIRANCVSPGWVSETLKALGRDPAGGTPAAQVAQMYVRALEGGMTGQIVRG